MRCLADPLALEHKVHRPNPALLDLSVVLSLIAVECHGVYLPFFFVCIALTAISSRFMVTQLRLILGSSVLRRSLTHRATQTLLSSRLPVVSHRSQACA